MEKTKHDVFISYSHKDYVDEHKNVIPGNEVSKIKEALTETGITYWFDEEGLYSGQNFVEKIVTNIENAKVFLFLSTANANKSSCWTCKEIATADELKKYILPVRIDATPYNKKVLFRIANLDYINYYANPQKGMEDMIKAIKAYLEEQAEAEKRKKEEEDRRIEAERKKEEELRLRKEEEERLRREEQDSLVEDIRSSSSILNLEETKLEAERSKLLVKTEKVTDKERRESLKTEITDGSPIRKKSLHEIKRLQDRLAELETMARQQAKKTKKLEMPLPILKKGWHVGYVCIILVLLFVACFRSCGETTIDSNHEGYEESNFSDESSEPLYSVTDGVIEFCIDSIKFNMVLVKGGTFDMGAQKEDSIADDYNRKFYYTDSPVCRVTLNDYHIGETEVTQALWEAVMGNNPSRWEDDNLPVENVSWDDCLEFLNKLNQKLRDQLPQKCYFFRFPTEAEWEFAARGGRKSRGYKYAGSDSVYEVSVCRGDRIAPVKSLLPNELGLYDMSGNVWEWCQDWKGNSSNDSQTDSKFRHVLRGGCSMRGPESCRVTSRLSVNPDDRHNNGLRLVLVHP